MLTRDQVREARTMFGRAGVDIETVEASTGSEVVRGLAESGETIVVGPAPAGRSTSASEGRYRATAGRAVADPAARGSGNRNGSGGSRPYSRRAA